MQNSQDRVSAFKVFAKVINYILERGGEGGGLRKKGRGSFGRVESWRLFWTVYMGFWEGIENEGGNLKGKVGKIWEEKWEKF